MAMNMKQTRVVDPVLTSVALGYTDNEHVGKYLFPTVTVTKGAGKIISFGKEAFQLYNAKRAVYADRKRVTFGYEGAPFSLEENSLSGQVARRQLRDTADMPEIDLSSRAINGVMRALMLSVENECAEIATNMANYDSNHKVTLTGDAKWTSSASNPLTDIEKGKDAVEDSTGKAPNVLLLGKEAYSALKTHPSIIEHFKYTSAKAISLDMLKDLLEIENIVVGRTMYTDENKKFKRVWGNNAILAYAPQKPSGAEEPSFGYNYTLEGHPMVEEGYFDNDSSCYLYPTTYECKPVLTGMLAGYLIKDPA